MKSDGQTLTSNPSWDLVRFARIVLMVEGFTGALLIALSQVHQVELFTITNLAAATIFLFAGLSIAMSFFTGQNPSWPDMLLAVFSVIAGLLFIAPTKIGWVTSPAWKSSILIMDFIFFIMMIFSGWLMIPKKSKH